MRAAMTAEGAAEGAAADASVGAAVGASAWRGKRVHFAGIGGAGMSGLAAMLWDAGAVVSGSELKPSETTLVLAKRGIKITYTQDGSALDGGIALYVRTAAVPDDNAEFRRAQALSLPHLKYAQLLGRVMADRFGVAVGGTHGKSTTTSMIAFALLDAGLDPSLVIGGTVQQLGGSSRSGSGKHFVVEACEYDRSFHQLRPRVVLLTNLEAEHLDVYRDLDDIRGAFATFARLVPPDGVVIGCGDDPNLVPLLRELDRPTQTYGFGEDCDWRIELQEVVRGSSHGRVTEVATGESVMLRPSLPGRHNLLNATGALAAARACGLPLASAADSIGRFLGVDRRMTEMGRYNRAIVVDDYGHHPTEIRATLAALRGRYQPLRLVCVFQPHQFSRTRILFDDFTMAFDDADVVMLPEIYGVRDSASDRAAVSSAKLASALSARGKVAGHFETFDATVDRLREMAREGDLIVTMGAGNVYLIAQKLVASDDQTEGSAGVERAGGLQVEARSA